MKKFVLVFILIPSLLILVTNSCKRENTTIYSEANKNVVGTWKITAVTRNGVDITNYFDFSAFNITFNEDGSYVITNPVPFVVSKNGKWVLDDLTHPLHISFTQNGNALTFTNEFNYPVVSGVRRIILTGSPGCVKNTYQYALVATD